ncbi:hypothetical protein Vadar_020644 [Vaccinium darrowii]|uniref:Uncharacterized protein n=1 Tax=Vaccinium darrowii TaxID=229202 RepID=A0ACB7ZLS9_9ERIC|nr:hypothetical protein Vadar_020644 [Vaccinium darrowii]
MFFQDVYQKIMLFMQQSNREICSLSASGSISNPSIREPATSRGNITCDVYLFGLSVSTGNCWHISDRWQEGYARRTQQVITSWATDESRLD